jgi:hypothetical protein
VTNEDYWLALAVYDEFRGIPVRKVIAHDYLDLGKLERERQIILLRLGSLFFQGRCWRKLINVSEPCDESRLSDSQRQELAAFHQLRLTIGAGFLRMLDEDESIDPIVRDIALERIEAMGFVIGDYKI